MKLLVETTGDFQLFNHGPEQWARHDRPSVVTQSNFFHSHAATGALKILGQLNDEATDVDFADQWKACEGDAELAVSNYVSQYPCIDPDADPAEAEAVVKPKTRAKRSV